MVLEEMDGCDGPESGRTATSTVCVTGSTGYVGSWLVRSLLHRGYTVHATARDLDSVVVLDKAYKLLPLWGDNTRLKLFRANMNEEGSFDEAVRGCVGVFHVAASMEFSVSVKENLEDYVQFNVLEPAVRGTINVLQACHRAGSVKRVVFTSSVGTITAKDDAGGYKPMVDESSSRRISDIWETKPYGWVYVLLKLLTEEAAFQFAKEVAIDLVSVIPPTIAGPCLTPTIPASIRSLLSPITGDPELYPILGSVHSRLGSIPLVHIEDICNAHIFLMEKVDVKGRYMCSTGSCVMSQLTDMLSRELPSFNISKFANDFRAPIPPVISSKRLTDSGFEFKHGISDIIKETVTCSLAFGLLSEASR